MLSTGFEVNTQPFLRLEDLLLPPPLPAIVALLMVLGTLYVSRHAPRWLRLDGSPVEFAASFVLTAGILGALVHALAWAGYASVSALRIGGWALAILGIVEMASWKIAALPHLLVNLFKEAKLAERCALALSLITAVSLLIAVLGPATDADSLNYHLGVPLDWLRRGAAYPRPDWFHARFVGLGEALNMLGLAAGTDGLGAVFQAAGLIVTVVALAAFAKSRANQYFALLLVIASPVIVFLINVQKPQLLPAAALTVALVIFVQRFETFDLATAIQGFGCASFAVASKHSCLLTGSIVVFVGLLAAARQRRLPSSFFVLAGCFAVFAVPVFARNFAFYGDPVSPMLERWRPDSDPALIKFAEIIRADNASYGDGSPVTLGKLLRLPWDLAITLDPRRLHLILGLGVFAFLFALRERGAARRLLLSALAAFGLVAGFAPFAPRFFLESYLWAAAAAVTAPWYRLKSLFFQALTVQLAVIGAVAIYLSSIFLPGIITQAGRDRVMTRMALAYAESKWLDATLPADAVLLTTGGSASYALLPRPFIAGDRFFWDPLTRTNGSEWKKQLTEFVREKRITVLVTGFPIGTPAYSWLAAHYGTPLAGPAEFRFAARSPFNRGNLIRSIAMRLDVEGTAER